MGRVKRFLARTPRGKYAAISRLIHRVAPEFPVPFRLPFGSWWLARDGVLDDVLLEGVFENDELEFVDRFLEPGMTVLDIGAHHGLYSLLASKRVGGTGRVISFEPSPRERRLLEQHLKLNSCKNVHVESVAVSDSAGTSSLYLVDGTEDGCNSMRMPATAQRTRRVEIETISLDEFADEMGLAEVDFVKLDVEGAELSMLRGAHRFLARQQRPVMLIEVQDIRCAPWGYRAKDVIRLLCEKGFGWYGFFRAQGLSKVAEDLESYDANLIAVPQERLQTVLRKFAIGIIVAAIEVTEFATGVLELLYSNLVEGGVQLF